MNTQLLERMAGLVIDVLVEKSVETFEAAAAREGINVPALYREAFEVGAATGIAETLKLLKEAKLLKDSA